MAEIKSPQPLIKATRVNINITDMINESHIPRRIDSKVLILI